MSSVSSGSDSDPRVGSGNWMEVMSYTECGTKGGRPLELLVLAVLFAGLVTALLLLLLVSLQIVEEKSWRCRRRSADLCEADPGTAVTDEEDEDTDELALEEEWEVGVDMGDSARDRTIVLAGAD